MASLYSVIISAFVITLCQVHMSFFKVCQCNHLILYSILISKQAQWGWPPPQFGAGNQQGQQQQFGQQGQQNGQGQFPGQRPGGQGQYPGQQNGGQGQYPGGQGQYPGQQNGGQGQYPGQQTGGRGQTGGQQTGGQQGGPNRCTIDGNSATLPECMNKYFINGEVKVLTFKNKNYTLHCFTAS